MANKTPIRRIGNSRGVIIPATILQSIGAGDELSMSVENGRIVLEPLRAPRKGWFDGALNHQTASQDELDWESADLVDTKDWEWK
jgi:antitoxin MazE